MANVRVYELAKELDMSNHELIAVLAAQGIQVKSHSSSVDELVAGKLRETLGKKPVSILPSAPPSITESAPLEEKREFLLPKDVTVKHLAEILGVAGSDIQKALMNQGTLVAVNQVLAVDLAKKVLESFGYTAKLPEPPKVEKPAPRRKSKPEPESETEIGPQPEEKADTVDVPSPVPAPRPKPKPRPDAVLVPRPPIVTILGHVDHGKTTLLDAIRETNVTEQEFGGITQHIGAYQVDVKGRKITFLDTPGHAAFTAMRARGAQVTDIVILVVAADDGVMPQTIEALNHAKAAGVQIIAAINKIDRDNANPERVKQQLAEHGLVVEEWGGDTVSVGISAKTRQNLDELLDMILLVSELLELKADPGAPVEATVVEAELDRGKGPIATVLVQDGTLKQGDSVVVGQTYGRIKAMSDDRGQRIKTAGPATPVEIVGLSSVPQAGDKLEVVKNEREARQIAGSLMESVRDVRLASTQRVTLADLYKQLTEGSVQELNLILKADVQGSEEAIRESLEHLSTDEVRVNLIHTGIGPVGENDVLLASASNAIVIGFNVRVDPQAKRAAEVEKIDVRTYNIIYELLDEVKAGMEGLLAPVIEETILGHVEVRQIFRLPRGGIIAGSFVKDGKIQRDSHARVMRDREVVFTGKIASLKHIKEDVREMAAGFECGIIVDGFTDFQVGDLIEAYSIEEIARKI